MLIVGVLIIIGSTTEILLLVTPSISSYFPQQQQPFIIPVLVSFHLVGIAFVVKSLLTNKAANEKQTGGYHKK
jgi:Na+/proline symporter